LSLMDAFRHARSVLKLNLSPKTGDGRQLAVCSSRGNVVNLWGRPTILDGWTEGRGEHSVFSRI
jgi:hypothetical protein